MNKEVIRKKIIDSVDVVKAPDKIFAEIVKIINKPEVQIQELFKVIEKDIELTVNILKLCNSTMYNLKHEISSLKEAIIYIGFTELKRMIMAVKTKKVLNNKQTGYEILKGELWRHSMATAIISKRLEKKVPSLDTDLYTTALLHDIGKIFIGVVMEDFTAQLENFIEENDCDFLEAEDEIFGINHAELGAVLLKKWKFPESMVFAVRNHHNPMAVEPHAVTDLIAVSNTIAQSMGYSTNFDALKCSFDPQILDRYQIKRREIEFIILESMDEIEEVFKEK